MPKLCFDEYCLTTSVTNLIQNAIEFTERGGIFVKLYRDAKTDLCLEIRDTGIGIDSSFLRQLSEPFSHESYDTARRFQGAGLG
jgi:signal transduction histidine kinase